MSCMPVLRVTRSSLSSWWRPRSRAGWRMCCARRLAAGTAGRAANGASQRLRRYWPGGAGGARGRGPAADRGAAHARSPGWTPRRYARGCGNWPARLLAASTSGGAHRPRHALLAEAVAAGLLPGERVCCTSGPPGVRRHGGGDAGRGGGRALGSRRPSGQGAAGQGGGGRGGRAGVRLRRGGGALAAGDRAVPGCASRQQAQARASTCRGCTCGRSRHSSYPGTVSRRASSPRKPTAGSLITRPCDRRGRPPVGPAHLPGDCGARRRAPADQGGTAAVRAGPAVGRSRRGLAGLRQRIHGPC